MSTSKDVSGSDTVFLSKRPKSDKRYHSHTNCEHIPDDPKEIQLANIQGHYDGCSACVDGAEPAAVSTKKNVYICQACLNESHQRRSAYRINGPCRECDQMTCQERKHE